MKLLLLATFVFIALAKIGAASKAAAVAKDRTENEAVGRSEQCVTGDYDRCIKLSLLDGEVLHIGLKCGEDDDGSGIVVRGDVINEAGQPTGPILDFDLNHICDAPPSTRTISDRAP